MWLSPSGCGLARTARAEHAGQLNVETNPRPSPGRLCFVSGSPDTAEGLLAEQAWLAWLACLALGLGAYHPPGSGRAACGRKLRADGGAESYGVACGLDRVAHNPTPCTPGPGCSAPARERRECSDRPWTPTAVWVCCLPSERIVPVPVCTWFLPR